MLQILPVGEIAPVMLLTTEARIESLSDTFELLRTQGQCSTLPLDCEKSLRTRETDAIRCM